MPNSAVARANTCTMQSWWKLTHNAKDKKAKRSDYADVSTTAPFFLHRPREVYIFVPSVSQISFRICLGKGRIEPKGGILGFKEVKEKPKHLELLWLKKKRENGR